MRVSGIHTHIPGAGTEIEYDSLSSSSWRAASNVMQVRFIGRITISFSGNVIVDNQSDLQQDKKLSQAYAKMFYERNSILSE